MTSAPVERDSAERDSANFDPSKPLAGLRVLDFSHALAGPFCTLILAEYGADVYKLESRDGGDIGRGWGPPDYGDQSSFFMGLNRGKFGISIDLKRPEGIELCLRLIETMDVLIENFRPGTMDRLGLGYDAVQARNPRIIYCSISGYGQDGPSRNEPAMDLIVQSSSGLMSITGTEESGPVRCGYSVADVSAGMFAIMGILMAQRSRDKTGRGQYIDVSMFDSMISGMTSCFMIYLGSNALPKPMGSAYPTIVPYRVFTAQDRDFSIAIGSEKLWTAFCAAINRPDLERHRRLRDQPIAREESGRDRGASLRPLSHAAGRGVAQDPGSRRDSLLARQESEGSRRRSAEYGPRYVSDCRRVAGRTTSRDRGSDQIRPRRAVQETRRLAAFGPDAGRTHACNVGRAAGTRPFLDQ